MKRKEMLIPNDKKYSNERFLVQKYGFATDNKKKRKSFME